MISAISRPFGRSKSTKEGHVLSITESAVPTSRNRNKTNDTSQKKSVSSLFENYLQKVQQFEKTYEDQKNSIFVNIAPNNFN
jgi:hypothetical protein